VEVINTGIDPFVGNDFISTPAGFRSSDSVDLAHTANTALTRVTLSSEQVPPSISGNEPVSDSQRKTTTPDCGMVDRIGG